MPIDVYESTDFECLWQKFESVIAQPQTSVLAKELVVVPGRGWSSVFSRRLAARNGCWAQFEVLPLGNWMAVVLANVLGQELAPEREPDSLTWAIAKRLRGTISDSDFGDVRAYLFADGSELDLQKLVDLARCIGRLFDRYLLDRPELVDGWQLGRDWPGRAGDAPPSARWQRKLWQSITAETPYRSIKAMTSDLITKLAIDRQLIPERVSVWITGGIAQSHLDFFEAVGSFTNISLYMLVPALEYWGDMQGRRALLKKLRTASSSLRQFCLHEHLDLLHPLLASCGELSRQQQMQMVDRDQTPWHHWELPSLENEAYRDVGWVEERDPPHESERSLLRNLQTSILHAVDVTRRHEDTDDELDDQQESNPHRHNVTDLASDVSLRIHSCHSALREVEVLRDQLRDAFELNAQLCPEDVVVMSPALENYAPFIQAVFGVTDSTAAGHIPFQLAGRSQRRTHPAVEAYFRLLAVLQGRFAISEIIDLLHIEAISGAAKLDPSDIEDVTQWAIDSGVRWGVDESHRQTEGLPPTDLNTWQFGLDRLLMGYAMPPGSEPLIGNIASLDRAEGLQGATLGRLWAFIRRLTDWRERIQQPHSIADWQPLLIQLAQEFIDSVQDESGVQTLLDAIEHLAKLASAQGFDQLLPFSVVVLEVEREVDEQASGGGFRIGGVTFCDLASLRSLPFAVVALLGLNDGEFPRSERPVRFDLIARAPQLGDRAPRHEDRHLFLEAILAAKSRLIITYQGQGIRDQKPRPPSVLVEELLDVLEQSVRETTEGLSLRQQLVVEHPLQAFSPIYFDGSNPQLFSFDPSLCHAAEGILKPRQHAAPFVSEALPAPEKETEINTDDLRLALTAPWKLFLQRLHLSLRDDATELQDREPMLLQGLERWSIGDRWLKQRLGDIPTVDIVQRLARSGQLPNGALGQAELEKISRGIERVVTDARSVGVSSTTDPLPIHITIASRTLIGSVKDWTAQGIRRATWSSLKTKLLIELWFDHLLATVSLNRAVDRAVLVTKDSTVELEPISVENAFIELDQAVWLYDIAQRFPLPFFPECVDVKKLCQRKIGFDSESIRDVMSFAHRTFEPSFQGSSAASFGPAYDLGIQQAFAGYVPLDMTCAQVPELADEDESLMFATLAQRIVEPLMKCIQVADSAGRATDCDTE